MGVVHIVTDSIEDERIFNVFEAIRNTLDGEQLVGNEFGLFDYNEDTPEEREKKWMVIAYMIDHGRIKPKDIGMMFKNNPFFFDWYKRNVMSDYPIELTIH
tara:strand:+ start:1120 stop:1422 length:303 start_codon:yes stop_codon:yes gene_type:complete